VQLVRTIGAGSTFEVALVEHQGRPCLCKRLRLRMVDEPAARHAMERETALLGAVHHPSVPQLIAAGDDQRGPYVLQTQVEGLPLRALVEGYAQRGEPMPQGLMTTLLRTAFEMLAELHRYARGEDQLGLVHGDIGPDHLLVSRSRVYLIDFGQARWRGMAVQPSRHERGTLPYLSPEVARGDREPDQASDAFALAATFAFAALGRDPCQTEGPAARLVEVAERGLDLEALRASTSLTSQARRALHQALAYDLQQRAADAEAVLALVS
jgi:serine/threonine protein kinase